MANDERPAPDSDDERPLRAHGAPRSGGPRGREGGRAGDRDGRRGGAGDARGSSDRRQFGERRGAGDAPRSTTGPWRGERNDSRGGSSRFGGSRDAQRSGAPRSDRRQGAGSRADGERSYPRRDGEGRPPRERDGARSGPGGERRAPARGANGRGGDAKRFGERGVREERTRPRVEAPDVPEEITGSMLDREARTRLRTLSKENAEDVGRHLVMAGLLLDEDPERAYKHAKVAVERAGRVDIAREAAAMTAYATGRFAEALREFRTVTRLNGRHDHLALVADCERGLGRPERALDVAASPESARLDAEGSAELQLVVAGARADLGQFDAALLTLDRVRPVGEAQAGRVAQARVEVLRAAGRTDEAEALEATFPDSAGDDSSDADSIDEDVVVYDLEDEEGAS